MVVERYYNLQSKKKNLYHTLHRQKVYQLLVYNVLPCTTGHCKLLSLGTECILMKTILNMDVNTKNNPRDDLGRGSSHRDNHSGLPLGPSLRVSLEARVPWNSLKINPQHMLLQVRALP